MSETVDGLLATGAEDESALVSAVEAVIGTPLPFDLPPGPKGTGPAKFYDPKGAVETTAGTL